MQANDFTINMPRAAELLVAAWAAGVFLVVLCRAFKVETGYVKNGMVLMLFFAGMFASVVAVQAWAGRIDLSQLVGLACLTSYFALSYREWLIGVPEWLVTYRRPAHHDQQPQN